MLQLRMGRLAHVLGIASGLALAVTAVLAYLLENWSYLTDAPEFVTALKWVVPLVGGLAVAIVAIAMKWEPYFADRTDPHFLMSIASVAVPSVLIALVALDEGGYIAMGRPDWLYSVSLLGMSLTLISLAMIWEGTSRRKIISIASAVFPPVLLIFPMLFRFTPLELASILPMAYLGSAVSIQLSGSMLHIIASSTNVQEREVLKASDGKLRMIIVDVEKRKEALEYREDALRSRESDLEAYEKRLSEELASVDDGKRQIESMEAELLQRVDQSRRTAEELARKDVENEGKLDTLRLKQADIDVQKNALDKSLKLISSREQKLAAREAEAEKMLLDVQAKERDARAKFGDAGAQEAELELWAKELDALKRTLADREKHLSMRENSLDMKSVELLAAKEQLGKVAAEKNMVKSIEQQLLMKQESVSEKEIALREKETSLRMASERAQRLIERSDKQMNELVDKENALLKREKAFADREAELRNSMSKLNVQLEEIERAKDSAGEREKQYLSLSESTRTKSASVSAKEQEITRKMAAIERRESSIKELEQRIRAEQEQMNSKLRTLLEREKGLKADETKMVLRSAELKARERDMLRSVEDVESARAEISPADDHSKTMELRERRLREKEHEMKARLYQREKELENRERALQAHLMKDLDESTEVQEEQKEAKVKTGIERLDDLLLGGMPFGSNILFAGPPFIGKETAMLLFIAEGLKKGVPVMIVTTSRPPVEIAKDMAPIMPTFMEFEQLGLVRWIDATGLPVDPNSRRSNVFKTKGQDDFDGILKGLDESIKQSMSSGKSYFRLAYLSLSMSITGKDEKRSFQFMQELTSKVRQHQAVASFAVEIGMHTDQQLNSIQHQMTGAIHFKSEKQKTLLSIEGICDAQTRGWIDYRHTNKAILMGAFSLERIR